MNWRRADDAPLRAMARGAAVSEFTGLLLSADMMFSHNGGLSGKVPETGIVPPAPATPDDLDRY
jgi:hypothetical protein